MGIKVEAFKDGQSMWTYETLREDKSTPAAIQWEANSKMTLNPASKLHKFINRNLHWGSSSRRLSLDVTGDAEFGAGPLAAASPVQTEVKLSFDVNNADLNGKFMKVYAGKEYSVVFQPGFTMPSIKIGA